jgi:hypothetical protein
MQCLDVQQALVESHDIEAELPAVVRDHLVTCNACQAFQRADQALDQVFASDVNEEPRPGFDTRFFARLSELKGGARRHRLTWGLGAFAASSAALVAFLALHDVGRTSFVEEIELAQNLELVEDLDVVTHLDDVEAFEVVAQLDLRDLDSAVLEPGRQP